MTQATPDRKSHGPWLVALGAALWGTESAWRIPLNDLFDARVIVFWEHVLILLMFLPLLVVRLKEIPKIDGRTWGYLSFSAFAGSAVGTVFFTLALKNGNPTVVNVILNIQPIFSTVAGRGVMTGMSLRLAASLRIVVGLICMSVILLASGLMQGTTLWPGAAQMHPGRAIGALILLASISGGIPLLIYFEGLRLTKASTAGYFEMMQTLAAVCITWGFFHAALRPHQVVAGLVLIAAVTMVQRVQERLEARRAIAPARSDA